MLETIKQNILLDELRERKFRYKILAVVVFRFCLDVMYIGFLSPLYYESYSGFTTQIRPFPYLSSLLAVILSAPVVVSLSEKRNASAILVTLFSYLYFLPLTSYYGCKGTVSPIFFALALGYWALLLFWQLKLPVFYLQPPNVQHARIGMTVLTVLACAIVMYVSWRYAGLRLTVNFIDVYGIRREAAKYQMPAILAYLLGAMPLVLSLLLVFWLQSRKWFVAGAVSLVYLFLFSISANKSYFFMLALILVMFFFYRSWFVPALPAILIALMLFGYLEYLVHGTSWIMSLSIRRVMYVPVAHSERFFQFFSENPVNLFREGIMGRLSFSSLYPEPIPRIIGEDVGEYAMNANNGLLGDMFANLPPWLGILIMPLLLVLCFRLVDLGTKEIDERLLLPFMIYFANSFINSSWSTVLLSHGFILACILLYLFPREMKEPKSNESL